MFRRSAARRTLALAVAGTAALGAAAPAGAVPPSPVPPGFKTELWAAGFVKRLVSIPASKNPYGTTDCQTGQSRKLWFLGWHAEGATVQCTIPAGTPLLVAPVWGECSNLETGIFYGRTAAEQAACARRFVEGLQVSPTVVIDGEEVSDLSHALVQSPQFRFFLPVNDIFGSDARSGTSVAYGYFLYVAPLSRGHHTLSAGGVRGDGSRLVTTFEITVP